MTRTTSVIPDIPLNDGHTIPQLGFGVFQIDAKDTAAAVARAFEAGCRHIDTAKAYGNEAQVGEAVRTLDEEVFVTTKYFNIGLDQGYDDARAAFEKSAERLGLDDIDLYLIHWPVPDDERYVDAWRALVDLQKAGRVRSIGVSNFQPEHLRRAIDATGVTPAVNQIELHPYLQQKELRDLHAERGIVTEAWSPLAKGRVTDDPVLAAIGEAHGKSAGQVVLRWHIQLGNVVFPKARSPKHVRDNFAIFDFELSDDEMAKIAGLDRGERTGPDPDTFSRQQRGKAA